MTTEYAVAATHNTNIAPQPSVSSNLSSDCDEISLRRRNDSSSLARRNQRTAATLLNGGDCTAFGVGVMKAASLLCLLAALCLGSPAFAATCADANLLCVGSGQEYTTIQAAANAAQPGDTVQVYAGTYAGFKTTRSGTPGNLITFRRNATDIVTVTGQVQIDHNYISINSFRFTYSNANEGGAALRVGYSSPVNHIEVSQSSFLVSGAQAFAAVFYANDLVFDENLIEGNPTIFIAVVANGQRQVYSNNTIRNIKNVERVFNVACSDSVFHGNEIYGLTWDNNNSVHPDIWQSIDDGSVATKVIIENNYVHDSPNVQLGAMEGHTVSDWTWRNNIFANMGTMYVHTGNFKFFNNTFYRSGSTYQAAVYLYSTSSGNASGADFRNNLFVQDSTTGIAGVASGSVSWSHSYNFVANTDFTSRSGWSETGGVNGGNPQFVGPVTNCVTNKCNFRIGATSAAKDKGATLSGFAVDMVSTARPQGAAWDMGAYEYCVAPNCGTGTPPSPPPPPPPPPPGDSSIWGPNTSPSVVADPDSVPIEVGVRFRTSVRGNVTAIRFYKASTNIGRHVGHLWKANGQLLATVTFLNESVSGWQEAKLATPVTLPAGDYVVSYHTRVGHYSINESYFTNNSVVSGPVTALADGIAGRNGVYVYGELQTPPIFPTGFWRGSNYWVDLVFRPAS